MFRVRAIRSTSGRLAILTAQDKVLQEELDQVAGKKRNTALETLDLQELNFEIAQMEEAARKVGAEVEMLNIELAAPPRIRVIENAVPPSS